MIRLTDAAACRSVTDKHPDYFTFDAETWFSDLNNYALVVDDNIAFAEYKAEGVYWVHFCYGSAKGRQAVELTKAMLAEFQTLRPVTTVVGFIELNNRKARWVVRQAGFKSLGTVDTKNGECEMFYHPSLNTNTKG